MTFQGVIFDLDGVLCSTDRMHYQAWKVVADKLNIPFDERDNDRLRGVSRMASLDIILEKYPGTLTQDEKLALASEKNEVYRGLLQSLTPNDLLKGVTETLGLMRAAGLRLAVGSSSRNTPLILRRIGLDAFFDAVSDGNNITHSKPHPEVFLIAADRLGLAPASCLVVEDAKAGIEAAKAGGFPSAGLGEAAAVSDYPLACFSDLRYVTGV